MYPEDAAAVLSAIKGDPANASAEIRFLSRLGT